MCVEDGRVKALEIIYREEIIQAAMNALSERGVTAGTTMAECEMILRDVIRITVDKVFSDVETHVQHRVGKEDERNVYPVWPEQGPGSGSNGSHERGHGREGASEHP